MTKSNLHFMDTVEVVSGFYSGFEFLVSGRCMVEGINYYYLAPKKDVIGATFLHALAKEKFRDSDLRRLGYGVLGLGTSGEKI